MYPLSQKPCYVLFAKLQWSCIVCLVNHRFLKSKEVPSAGGKAKKRRALKQKKSITIKPTLQMGDRSPLPHQHKKGNIYILQNQLPTPTYQLFFFSLNYSFLPEHHLFPSSKCTTQPLAATSIKNIV